MDLFSILFIAGIIVKRGCLGLCITVATDVPIAQPPDDTMNVEQQRNETDRRIQRKTCPNITLSTTNSTRTALGVNLGFCGEKPVTALAVAHPIYSLILTYLSSYL
jgi:hypothetical protein